MAKKVNRAGVIPYYMKDEEPVMLFMKPSKAKYGGDTFQIAKGKVEEGESLKTAGLREAKEELGLFEGNISELYELGTFMGRTTVYVAKIKDPEMFGLPGEETGDTKWMTKDEFLSEGRDLHKPVIKAAVRLIAKKENA